MKRRLHGNRQGNTNTMSQQQNICIAQQLLAQIGKGGAPDKIADSFSGDVEFEIAGDVDALPWIGMRTPP